MCSYTLLFVTFWRFPSRRSNIGGTPSLLSSLPTTIFPNDKMTYKIPWNGPSSWKTLQDTCTFQHFLRGEGILVHMRSKTQLQHPSLLPVFVFYKGVGEFDTWNYFIFPLLYLKALEYIFLCWSSASLHLWTLYSYILSTSSLDYLGEVFLMMSC